MIILQAAMGWGLMILFVCTTVLFVVFPFVTILILKWLAKRKNNTEILKPEHTQLIKTSVTVAVAIVLLFMYWFFKYVSRNFDSIN
jgi:uncharacterized membrane protein